MKNSAARIAQLIALAVSAQAVGSFREAQAAICGAARIAATHGADILPLTDAANLSLLCTIPWTEEAAPRVLFTAGPSVKCADGKGSPQTPRQHGLATGVRRTFARRPKSETGAGIRRSDGQRERSRRRRCTRRHIQCAIRGDVPQGCLHQRPRKEPTH